MLYEHWHGPDSSTLVAADSPTKGYCTAGETLCCTITAGTWGEACRLYHAHMGWEPYVPEGE